MVQIWGVYGSSRGNIEYVLDVFVKTMTCGVPFTANPNIITGSTFGSNVSSKIDQPDNN